VSWGEGGPVELMVTYVYAMSPYHILRVGHGRSCIYMTATHLQLHHSDVLQGHTISIKPSHDAHLAAGPHLHANTTMTHAWSSHMNICTYHALHALPSSDSCPAGVCSFIKASKASHSLTSSLFKVSQC